MGCVYYHALTGVYPFNGETGPQVMAAHLQHKVTPIQDLRAGIPLWICDWIMWHINRKPEDRPESARESLQVFLQNDKDQNPPMSTGTPSTSGEAPKRPRLIIPGSVPEKSPTSPVVVVPDEEKPIEAAKTQTAPQPLTPPEGFKPSVHSPTQSIKPETPPQDNPPIVKLTKAVAATATVPVLKAPVKAATVGLNPAKPVPVSPTAPGSSITLSGAEPAKKRGLDNTMKVTIAVMLGLAALFLGYYLLKQSGKNTQTKIFNAMMQQAAKPDATEVIVNASTLKLLLQSTISLGANEQRNMVYKALVLAKASDATDVDAVIAEFATKTQMISDIREALITQVIGARKKSSVIPMLLAYSKSTDDTRTATAALKAARYMVDDSHFPQFLEVIQSASNADVRQAAEEAVAEIIKNSANRAQFGTTLASAYQTATNQDVRHSLLRLLGRNGDAAALGIAKELLAKTEPKEQVAALVALASWGNESAFPVLIEYLARTTDSTLRGHAFESSLKFITSTEIERDGATRGQQWNTLASEAKLQVEQDKIVRELAINEEDEWVIPLVEKFAKESEYDRIIDLAERALDRLRERARLKSVDEGKSDTPESQDE
jgi:hypothetical protein